MAHKSLDILWRRAIDKVILYLYKCFLARQRASNIIDDDDTTESRSAVNEQSWVVQKSPGELKRVHSQTKKTFIMGPITYETRTKISRSIK